MSAREPMTAALELKRLQPVIDYLYRLADRGNEEARQAWDVLTDVRADVLASLAAKPEEPPDDLVALVERVRQACASGWGWHDGSVKKATDDLLAWTPASPLPAEGPRCPICGEPGCRWVCG